MPIAPTPPLPGPHPPRQAVARETAEDMHLIRRIAAHDAEAFTTLYQRYAPRLAGFVAHRLVPPDQVDDVLHETFLVVWRDAARFRGQAQLSTWLLRIAQRKAHQARKACQPLSALPGLPAAPAPDDPPRRLLQQERHAMVSAVLATLAPSHRTVLELRYGQGWSLPAIAAHLGCAVCTVQLRLRRARRSLAVQLRHAARLEGGGGV